MRVGLIGAGLAAELHLPVLRKIRDVQIVGILDIEPGAAETAAVRFGVLHHFDERARFYEQAKPDIVHVLTPPATHRAIAVDALARKIHVLTEKPMAMTPEDCGAMEAAAGANGVTLGVDHNFLFDPRVRLSREMVQQGAIGTVVHVETVFGFDIYRVPYFSIEPGRRTHWAYRLPGGLLEDLLPHPLYLTLAFLGEEPKLTHQHIRMTSRSAANLPDELRISLAGRCATANLTMSLSIRPDEFAVTVYGTKGTIKVDIQNMLVHRIQLGRGPRALARGVMVSGASIRTVAQMARNVASLALGRVVKPADLGPSIRAYYGSLATGGPPPVGPYQGKQVVEIIRQLWPT